MALSSRERVLVLLIPSALVIGGYGLGFLRTQMRSLENADKSLTAARNTVPSELEQNEVRMRLAILIRDVNQASQDVAAVRKRWEAAAGKADVVPSRPECIERLNKLFADAGLRVIDATDGLSVMDGRSFPAETLARPIIELTENQQPKPRLLRFFGRYSEVAQTLDALNRGDLLAVPLGLTMKEADIESPYREWSILVWV